MKNLAIVGVLLAPPWLLFGLCCYWYFIDTEPPATHTSVRAMNLAGETISKVQHGATFVLARESCVHRAGRAFYTRTLSARDTRRVYFMPSGEVHLIPGCSTRFNSVTIPEFVIPGLYDYIVTVTFENNPFVDSRMVLPIPTIEVIP